jgi:hypothetical protein
MSLSRTLSLLDQWLDSMRAPNGYAGPVSHWWQSSLVYCGAMHDWRYEGIVCGYLNLYRLTQESRWLEKACRACDDLVNSQRADGGFFNPVFEHGVGLVGTPHEAAALIALQETAAALPFDDPRVNMYRNAAARNLTRLRLLLWTPRGVADQPDNPVLVPNKNATMLEATLLYQQWSGEDCAAQIEAMAQVILSAQVKEPGERFGATIHRGTFGHQLSFGMYTARCVGAFCRLLELDPRPAYREFVRDATRYLENLLVDEDVLIGHFRDGSAIGSPRWLGASGDVLRALIQARKWVDVSESRVAALGELFVRAQSPCGGIATGYGLKARGAVQSPSGLPDFRDVLPVVGWVDKVFRALTLLGVAPQAAMPAPFQTDCMWLGKHCVYYEDSDKMVLKVLQGGMILYDWRKGKTYPEHMDLWL